MRKKRSLVQTKFYDSVTISWLDRPTLGKVIAESIDTLVRNEVGVREVILFGSAASGRSTPGSDVDVLILVDRSDDRPMKRADRFLCYFDDIDLGVDLFVYTENEAARSIPLIETARETGQILFRAAAGGNR